MSRRRAPREVETVVVELDDDGLGLGDVDGREVRSRNALPGEKVNVRVLKRRRGVWYGEADTPASDAPAASRWRRSPPCEAYPRCGGCAMQHVDYPRQLEHKQARLERLLTEGGLAPQSWRPPVHGPRFHYRYKARLGVRVVGEELLAGFREGFSNRVVRMDDCKTLALPFARMLPDLKATLGRLSQPDRVPQVELAAGDRDFAVILRHLVPLEPDDRRALAAFGARNGIRVFVQPGGYDSVAALTDGAEPCLSYANPDFGLCFEFLPTDFIQVNPFVNRLLVRETLLALAPEPDAVVADLFCGIGNFSLALARTGARVIGLEGAAGAVARARHNAERNGLTGRAEFAVADLYDSRSREAPESDHMLLDPPRSGAGPNLAYWAAAPRLRRIAYVSCNPRSFADDAAVLAQQGFELVQAGIFDMFPHTAHVETLGIFQRGQPARQRG